MSNFKSATALSGYSGCTQYLPNYSVNGNNQLTNTGFAYDAAGEMTNDGVNTYAYDAKGRQTSAAGVTYTYDGDGRRVEKSNGMLYWYGGGSAALYETDLSGGYIGEYVFFGGRRVARINADGSVYHYLPDALGSSTVMVKYPQNGACYEADFEPYGREHVITNTCAQNYKFTGLERDAETGDDHTMFRQMSSTFGRWLSPDPLAGDVSNPQSLNRYAYVLNNPINLTDVLGLGPQCTWDEPDCNPVDECAGIGWVSNPECPGAQSGGGGIIIFGGGGGGGGGGNGSGGGAASAGGSTIGSGMGNAAFGGLITCTQVSVVINGVPIPSGPLICTLNTPPWLLALLHRPWMISWVVPIGPEPGVLGVGPAGGFAFNPDTHTVCGSLGIGASAGHNVAVGPITIARMWNGSAPFPSGVNQILSGWSASPGGNLPATGGGATAMINGAGAAAGPTLGVPGVSAAATDSLCVNFP